MPDADKERQFSVHARDIDSHHARTLTERSFEAAALAYVEDLHPIGDDADISVIVRDVASGQVNCFRIDLDTGESAPCALRTN